MSVDSIPPRRASKNTQGIYVKYDTYTRIVRFKSLLYPSLITLTLFDIIGQACLSNVKQCRMCFNCVSVFQVITVQAVINGVTKTFTLNNLSSVKVRQDLGSNGVEDMVTISDLNEASILWNLRIRYDNANIYTYVGSILVAVNPYRMFTDAYGLDAVAAYDGKILG